VNWQRDISIQEIDGRRVVLKKDKAMKDFHDYLLASTYCLVSVLCIHPAPPPPAGRLASSNEGSSMRTNLTNLGIPTPLLLSITKDSIVEEYIEGGNLYAAFAENHMNENILGPLAFQAGCLTGRLHKGGYVFTDNKSQNYLVKVDNTLVRTDLGFVHKTNSLFARSMDIASFLASVIDLNVDRYKSIEQRFRDGYISEVNRDFPYLWILLRNIISLGFAANQSAMLQNITNGSITYKKNNVTKVK
jgi:tRNA A-37 threonylcarbamoyl transferase component Bud32